MDSTGPGSGREDGARSTDGSQRSRTRAGTGAAFDEPDARNFGNNRPASQEKTGDARRSILWEPNIPEKLDCYVEALDKQSRGFAVIFHHEKFDGSRLPARPEVRKDVENLTRVFVARGFTVKAFKDLRYESIKKELIDIAGSKELKVACSKELKDHDCFILCFLSHGKEGRLYAKDKSFDEKKLWNRFYDCEALVGKPKLFFIQACRGNYYDDGMRGNAISTDSSRIDTLDHDGWEGDEDVKGEYHLPTHANVLIAHATYEGHVAWKSENVGSYFVYTVCKVLEKHSETMDVMTMLTIAAGVMAEDFMSVSDDLQKHEKKQMPTIRSTLTRKLYLKPKPQP